MNNYIKGSEWRKWDLHVHTPASIIQNYGGNTKESWDNFIKKIASLPSEIKVLGITDYLFINGYEEILKRRDEIPNIELILPNIEFRLDTFSGTENNKKRHNFHVIFDPTVKPSDIKEQLLNCLATAYLVEDKKEWNSTPTPDSLSELGIMIKSSAPQDNSIQNKSDIEVGFDNITYKREDILKLLKKHQFSGKFLLGMGYTEWDQSRWDQSAALKRDLINGVNFCLTSYGDVSKIKENIVDLEKNKLNNIVLHSSDAHELKHIGITNLWIKADPIFAGFRQILNEPKSRIFLGITPPNYKNSHEVISRMSISESNGWFPKSYELELNRDLVSIIGGRGSGKSAVAEMLAYGAGSKDESSDSFINKASKHLKSIKGTKIKLTWEDGHNTENIIGSLLEDQGNIKYLPQKAVEQLCSPNSTEELLFQIENVIFQALEATQKMGTSNFRELQERILKSYSFRKKQLIVDIQSINRTIFDLEENIKSLPQKEKELNANKGRLKILQDTLPKLPAQDVLGQEELAKLAKIKKIIEEKIIEQKLLLEKLNEIQTEINLLNINIRDYLIRIKLLTKEVDINDASVFLIKLNEEAIKKVLEKKRDSINQIIITLERGEKKYVAPLLGIKEADLYANNLSALKMLIQSKIDETQTHETVKIKYQQQKSQITEVEKTINSLGAEIKEIKEYITNQLKINKEERISKYCEFFEVLKSEKIEIKKLYYPLQQTLMNGTDTDTRLNFIAKIKYNMNKHALLGLSILDRTRKGNFREEYILEQSLNGFWESCLSNDFKSENIKKALFKLESKFLTTTEGVTMSIEEQIRDDYTSLHFYDWLYNLDCFEVVSSLEFDGTELYLLSPGQKGIVLLMLYLHIDNKDQRPLIIDQPEDNLDNLSVYNDLIEFFRKRKLFRQIIIITHNPNLVVNTDAEQVIVANYNGKRNPRLNYISGSLENHLEHKSNSSRISGGIIEQVCDILEGGKIAFIKRGKKYISSGINLG